jgi:long-chain acyl-CoA synthetase
MYAGVHAKSRADQPAFVMAQTGVAVTYAELEQRTNRLAHFLRSRGLKRLDHYAIFMDNNDRYIESCGAGERAGLYFTCVNSFLTADEVAYVVNNSESRILIVSEETRATALAVIGQCPNVEAVLVVNGPGDGSRILNFDEATAGFPTTPIADETIGTAMLYSSGTTGRPKGILRPLPDQAPSQQLPLFDFLQKL